MINALDSSLYDAYFPSVTGEFLTNSVIYTCIGF